MTDDERREAERVFEAAISDFLRGIASRDEIERAIDVIAAARARWQNEALEGAAQLCDRKARRCRENDLYPAYCLNGQEHAARACAEEIRALKK